MTVSQHALKAPAPGVTQFDSLPVAEAFARTSVAWMGPEDITQLPVEDARGRNWLPPLKKALFVAREYGGTTQRI